MRYHEIVAKNSTTEDRHPNDRPYGPEAKPTMPKGTVRVDVSDVYDWYKLGMNISDLKKANKSQFGKGPPSTIVSFGDENTEHKYIKDLENLGLTTTDIDPVDPNQPRGMPRQKVDPTFNVDENFADGKVKGKSRPGRVKRAGASCNGSVTDLRARAKNASGEKAKMYHWCANMKSGRKKANEASPTGLEFKGYPCTKDCSGHQAGHDWAERWGIENPDSCPYSNNSFWEGCLARTDDFQDE